MALLARIVASFDAIKPVPDLIKLDNELNQLVGTNGALNGGSTTNRIWTQNNHATDPVYEMNQLGAGDIAQFKQAGTLQGQITNSGQYKSNIATGTAPIVVASQTMVTNLNANFVGGQPLSNLAQLNTNVAAWSVGWFIADPSVFPTQDETQLGAFIVPAGTAITATKIKVSFWSGSHTTGGSLDFRIVFTNAAGGGAAEIGSVLLSDTNNTIKVTYNTNVSTSPAEGDHFTCKLAARSGTITERSVSVALIGTQRLT